MKNDQNKIIELSYLQFQIVMEIGYAITAHISQGQTFTKPYTIHEWNHWHASKNWKLVSVSRTTNKNNIYISTAKPTRAIKGKIYKISNSVNNKIYFGSTVTTVQERFESHLESSLVGGGDLYKAMRKLGRDKFRVEQVKAV